MIKTLKLSNFTVFKEAELEFSPGLNVIVGENGTGKSHLLKLAYTILRSCVASKVYDDTYESTINAMVAQDLMKIFACKVDALFRKNSNKLEVESSWGRQGELSFTIFKDSMLGLRSFSKEKIVTPLFIPPKEIISIYKGFRAAVKNRELAFDYTYHDLAEALDNAPFTGKKFKEAQDVLKIIENLLNATIVRDEGGNFYFVPLENKENFQSHGIHAQMSAEGHRKFGMLAYLIINGCIRNGTSIFWDEPEATMNPKLLILLARIITELSKITQITIATHSLFLLRELEILQQEKALVGAKYFGLHFSDDGVTVTQGDDSNSIGDIAALDTSIEQADRYLSLD